MVSRSLSSFKPPSHGGWDTGVSGAALRLAPCIAWHAPPGVAFMVSPGRRLFGRCVWLVCVLRLGV